jgi:hypothetical protein
MCIKIAIFSKKNSPKIFLISQHRSNICVQSLQCRYFKFNVNVDFTHTNAFPYKVIYLDISQSSWYVYVYVCS